MDHAFRRQSECLLALLIQSKDFVGEENSNARIFSCGFCEFFFSFILFFLFSVGIWSPLVNSLFLFFTIPFFLLEMAIYSSWDITVLVFPPSISL